MFLNIQYDGINGNEDVIGFNVVWEAHYQNIYVIQMTNQVL